MIPGQAQQFFEAAAAQAGGGYEIERSLRFNSGDSPYLNRTPSVAGDRQKWTWSGWVKRSTVADSNWRALFTALNPDNSNRNDGIWYSGSGTYPSDQLYISFGDSADIQFENLFRDVSAWYHLVVAVDTTQSTASNRIKAYVNGVQLNIESGSQPTQNYKSGINNTTSHSIGRRDTSNSQFFDGYLADVHFIDGSQLAASDFGEDDDNMVWQPKAYDGSYGPSNTVDYSGNGQTALPDGNVYLSTQPVGNIFDGDESTYARINRGTNSQTVATFRWQPTGGFANVTKIEIKTSYTDGYSINGGEFQSHTQTGFTEIYNGSSFTLTQLDIRRTDASGSDYGIFVYGIKINDVLITNVGNTGFHLDFSDNSSASALGTDSSGNSNDWTVNNISVIDSDGTIYAEYSGSSNQYLRNNSGNVLPGSNGAFTIECHFYPHTTNVVGLFDGGSGSTSIMRNYGNNTIEKQSGGSVSFAGDYTQNAWNHIAVVYTGSSNTDTLTVYVNGVSSGSSSGLNGFTPGSTFDIGVINGGGDGRFDGYIRNFRVTHSAVYTSDFTAPSHTDNLTALADTKLLVITTPALGLTGAGPGTTLGMSNNGSVSEVTLAAASQNDSFIDSPSNYQAASGNNGGNYCTLNPLDKASTQTVSNGDLQLNINQALPTFATTKTTFGISSGKFYWEFVKETTSTFGTAISGIWPTDETSPTLTTDLPANITSYTDLLGFGVTGGNVRFRMMPSGNVQSGSYSEGQVIGIAFDADAGKFYAFINGSELSGQNISAGTSVFDTVTVGKTYVPFGYNGNGGSGTENVEMTFNFGQKSYAFPPGGTGGPPSDYKSVCSTNLTDPTIAEGSTVMDPVLWTGNGGTQTISGLNFAPSFIWHKIRSIAGGHQLYDNVRGTSKRLRSDTTAAESTLNGVTAFNSDGWTMTAGNNNNETYVSWTWDGGDLVTDSRYNQSQEWSTFGDNNAKANENWFDVFDGSLTAGPHVVAQSGTTTVWTLSTPITFTKLELYANNDGVGDITLNGNISTTGTIPAGGGANIGWADVTSLISNNTLTSIEVPNDYNTDPTRLGAIKVDDKYLLDPGVIPVGSISDLIYDQSQIWSGQVSGSTYTNKPKTNAFNGTKTYTNTAAAANNSTLTFTPSGFSSATSVKIWVRKDNGTTADILLNGSSIASSITGLDATNNYFGAFEFTVSGFTSLEWGTDSSNAWFAVAAIEVDGKTLIDSNQAITLPTIASKVRANTSSGFSIASWTGNGSTSPYPRIAHGLNAKPLLYFLKSRDGARDWIVYTDVVDGSLDFFRLNTNAAKQDSALPAVADTNVFYAGGADINTSGEDIIAYCFAPIAGYSAFGSYTGNGGSNGPFVYTGFRPAFILIKRSSATENWMIIDTARNTYNVGGTHLMPNNDLAEATSTPVDHLSNGFKIRTTSGAMNGSGSTYIWGAFAEHPFKTARAR